jgi:hypothetical protein
MSKTKMAVTESVGRSQKHRQLDGGRDFVAGKDFAFETNRKINRPRTRVDFPRNKIRRGKIP